MTSEPHSNVPPDVPPRVPAGVSPRVPPDVPPGVPPGVPTPATGPGFLARVGAHAHRFLERLVYLLAPIALTGLILLVLLWLQGPTYVRQAITAGAFSLFFFGTSVVLGRAIFDTSLGSWELAFIVMWVNSASAFWYAYNLDLMERLPKIGPALKRMRREGVETLKRRRWIKRLSTIGVGAFVISPLPGSGSLGGAVMGRLIGLSRFAISLTVSLAGVVVCVAYALFTDKLRDMTEHMPVWVKIAGAIAAIGAFFLLARWIKRRGNSVPAVDEAGRDDPNDTTGSGAIEGEGTTDGGVAGRVAGGASIDGRQRQALDDGVPQAAAEHTTTPTDPAPAPTAAPARE